MALTKSEKERIIRHLQDECQKVEQQLREQASKRATVAEQKVLRRLNSVSVTLWNVKIKDSLLVERKRKTTVKNLLADITRIKQQESVNALRISSSAGSRSVSASASQSSILKDNSGRISKR